MSKGLRNGEQLHPDMLLEVLTPLINVRETMKFVNVGRTALTSTRFDTSTASKLYGNMTDMSPILSALLPINLPLSVLLSGKTRSINSTTYKSKFEDITLGTPADGIFLETANPSTVASAITETSNISMLLGVATDVSRLAQRLALVPNQAQTVSHNLQVALMKHNMRKEYFLWFGDKDNGVNLQTDGLYQVINESSSPYKKAYTGSTGTNVLQQDDLEEAIYTCIEQGADPRDLVIFTCSKAHQTISSWFNDKIQYTSSPIFRNFDLSSYPIGNVNVPIVTFDSKIGYSTNVLTDKVFVVDSSQLGIAYTLEPFAINMPSQYLLNIDRTMVAEMFGLEYGNLYRFAMISGIDQR